MAQRGRCHRFVFTEDDGRPPNCIGAGQVRLAAGGQGRWYLAEGCDKHSSQLVRRPPGRRVGYR
jgi:hypothetical protein